jgi:hypothetical protein
MNSYTQRQEKDRSSMTYNTLSSFSKMKKRQIVICICPYSRYMFYHLEITRGYFHVRINDQGNRTRTNTIHFVLQGE